MMAPSTNANNIVFGLWRGHLWGNYLAEMMLLPKGSSLHDSIADHYGNARPDVLLLAWLLKLPNAPLPVIGTTRAARLAKAVEALHITLSDEHWFLLLAASRGHEIA
ncbi:MAG: hypothetical protein R2795_01325 [Saprospiraceae bacterium]